MPSVQIAKNILREMKMIEKQNKKLTQIVEIDESYADVSIAIGFLAFMIMIVVIF